ncbi:hypothetical protein BVRB_7g160660 [Beta vulgaris subsp. vulgaris]|nr:hypothetical protein BVRB_7g160660 [Beta vulgaris subsp. vulgaris]
MILTDSVEAAYYSLDFGWFCYAVTAYFGSSKQQNTQEKEGALFNLSTGIYIQSKSKVTQLYTYSTIA